MKIAREVLKVVDKTHLTPHLIRITFTGKPAHISQYKDAQPGLNNKIFIPSTPLDYSFFEDDYEARKSWFFDEMQPIRRTYTHRKFDDRKNELSIDFVAHGDEGPASAWALRAKAGDCLGVAMKLNAKELFPDADTYFLAGDATALPVLSAILEQLPAGADAHVLLEVHGKQDELQLPSEANINLRWLHNQDPTQGSQLAEHFRGMVEAVDADRKFAYVASEYKSVKAIRQLLKKEWKWDRSEFYAYSYWKSGQAEDKSEAFRRAEKDA